VSTTTVGSVVANWGWEAEVAVVPLRSWGPAAEGSAAVVAVVGAPQPRDSEWEAEAVVSENRY
jgi:hypothetical protein